MYCYIPNICLGNIVIGYQNFVRYFARGPKFLIGLIFRRAKIVSIGHIRCFLICTNFGRKRCLIYLIYC